jgi:hypothetical protein
MSVVQKKACRDARVIDMPPTCPNRHVVHLSCGIFTTKPDHNALDRTNLYYLR